MLPEVIVGVVEHSDPQGQDGVQTFRSPAHACKCLNSVSGFYTIALANSGWHSLVYMLLEWPHERRKPQTLVKSEGLKKLIHHFASLREHRIDEL